ncbi:MAG: hemolysin III family protein [Bacteroidota bacterium]
MKERTWKIVEKEEWASTWTHAIGVVLSIMALYWVIWLEQNLTLATWIGVLIYATSLLLVYLSSTSYHAVRSPKLKFILQRIDHICIYFLIAGTHTPFALFFMEGPLLYGYLAVLWSLVALGILYKMFFFQRFPILSLVLYLLMGWMVVPILPYIWDQIPVSTFWWILGGGLLYTGGTAFYRWESLVYHHAIWHVFVLGGSIAHFIGISQLAIN